MMHVVALFYLITATYKTFPIKKYSNSFFKIKIKLFTILSKSLAPLPIMDQISADILTSPFIFTLC